MRQTFQVETRPTITEFLLREQRRVPAATGAFTAVVNNVRLACKRIAHAIGQGALCGHRRHRRLAERPGRDADAARRAGRRDLRADQRVERHARRPGVRGARGSHPHPGGAPARALPPRVRPARRLVQHRRERLRGQHLLGAALPRGRDRAGRAGLPAARHAAGGRRLRDLRPDHDAGPHPRPRHARLHARPQHGRVHPHAPRHDDPGRDARVRDQRLERALLGAAGAPLRGRVRAGQVGAARRRLQHALDRLDGGRGAPHPRARRPLHVPARHQGPVQARAPAPACTRRTRWG